MQKCCLTCKDPLRGRSDQRFCSDYCRNRFHNQKRKKEQSFIRQVDRILRQNRKILHQLASNYRLRISKEELMTIGFQFNYCTSWQLNANQEVVFFCYDMAYRQTKEDVLIYHSGGRTIP